ncbi:MAG: LysR family transcriptional regulator [Nannocystales bacterium]
MDRQTEMEAFVAVVEEGGFSAAARRLRITPSAVSKQVARLETRLGVALLRRTTRGVQSSESGGMYFERAKTLLGELARLDRDVTHFGVAPAGLVRVSVSALVARRAVLPNLSSFLEAHPNVQLSFQLSDDYVDLVQERFDVAVRVGELEPASFVARKVGRLARVVVASPEYLAAHGTPQTPEELTQHRCLGLAANGGLMNRWAFREDGHPSFHDVCGPFEVDTAEGVYNAALAGVGIVRLGRIVVCEAVRSGRLQPILEPYAEPEGAPLNVVYPSARHPSLAAKLFADWLVEQLREAVAESA